MTGIVLSALYTFLNSKVEVAESNLLMQIYLLYNFVVPLLLVLRDRTSNFERSTEYDERTYDGFCVHQTLGLSLIQLPRIKIVTSALNHGMMNAS